MGHCSDSGGDGATVAIEEVKHRRIELDADRIAGLEFGALVLPRDQRHTVNVDVDQRVGAQRLDQLHARQNERTGLQAGDAVKVELDPSVLHFFNREGRAVAV